MNRWKLGLFLSVLLLTFSACGAAAEQEKPLQPPPATVESPFLEASPEPQEQTLISLDVLLEDIYAAAPGNEDSTLRQARAAGELLDLAMELSPEDLTQLDAAGWVEAHVPAEDAAKLALAWAI